MHSKKRIVPNLAILAMGLVLAGPCLAEADQDEAGTIGVTFRGGAGSYVTDADGVRVWMFRSSPRVLGVAPGGPAADVLVVGDIVMSVDGHPVTTLEASRALQRPRVGRSLRVGILRGDVPMTMDLVAVSRSTVSGGDMGPASQHEGEAGRGSSVRARTEGPFIEASDMSWGGRTRSWLGMGLEMHGIVVTVEKDGHQLYYFDEPPVVYNVDPGGPAALAGLQRGDVLLGANGVRFEQDDGGEFFAGEMFSSVEPGQEIRLTFRRDGREKTTTLVAQDYADLDAGSGAGGAGTGGQFVQNLRYAGHLGGLDIEVRGLGRVVVSRTADELVIRIDDATVTLSRDE